MLKLEGVALQRGGRWLFRDVSMRIQSGWKVGLTGANGSGKSSLLAVFAGALETDAGAVDLPRGWRVAQSDQEVAGVTESAIDYVLAGDTELTLLLERVAAAERGGRDVDLPSLHAAVDAVDGYTARVRAERVLQGLGFSASDRSRAVATFSGGWRVRLNLARALLARADLLLLDEPTNHLDLDAVCWLESWLARHPGTIVTVSHDRDFLDGLVTHIAQVDNLGIELSAGNYSQFESRRADQLLRQAKLHQRQSREAARLHRFVERFRSKATKARQAQSRLKQLERMERVEPAHSKTQFRFSFPEVGKTPDPMLKLERVCVGYEQLPVLGDVSLTLRPGDRIGLLGRNGAGKSTLMGLLGGLLVPSSGSREIGPELRIGYFAQHQLDHLDLDATPVEHLKHRWPDIAESTARSHLGGFGFNGDRALEPVRSFSGGEKARLALAVLVRECPGLLLLDEPTNHLDLAMRHALTVALQAYEGALMLVSHDRFLLRACCDRFLLVADGVVTTFDGDLDEYQRWLGSSSGLRSAGVCEDDGESQGESRKKLRQRAADIRRLAAERRKPIERDLKEIETQLETLVAERHALESTLADPASYAADKDDLLVRAARRRGELGVELERLEARWIEASEALERC